MTVAPNRIQTKWAQDSFLNRRQPFWISEQNGADFGQQYSYLQLRIYWVRNKMLSNFCKIKGYQPNLPSVLVLLNDDLVNSAWWLILVFHTGLPIFWQLGLMWSRGSLQIPCYCNCSSANQIHGPSTDLLYVWTIWHFTFSHFDLQVNQLWLNFWSTKCRCGSRISARGVVKGHYPMSL